MSSPTRDGADVPVKLTNIAAHLPRMARLQPDTLAIAVPIGNGYRRYTFAELDRESDRYARGLETYGIGRGTRTVVMVPPGFEFFTLTFALFKAAAVPVLVDPGMGVRNLRTCLEEAEPEAFIGIPKAHLARRLLGWAASASKKIVVTPSDSWLTRLTTGAEALSSVVDRAMPAGSDSAFPVVDADDDEVAAILFTSGSTGVPKGAVYTHGNFAAQVEKIRDTYSIEPGEIDLPTFPLFGLFDPALGMSAVIPEMDFTRPAKADPRKLEAAITEFGITNMFGSPALINRFGRYGVEHEVKLPTLRRVLSAGAPVAPQVLERFQQLLSDDVQVFTPYGATEALPVSSIGSREVLTETGAKTARGEGVCVGRPVAGVEVKIIEITDEPIEPWSEKLVVEPGTIGEIVVRGENVTRSYYRRDHSTALAKISCDDSEEEFYHRMGDLGYFDDDGRLWFCGRKSHRVRLANETLFTIPCEGIFNAHPRVFRSALVGVPESASHSEADLEAVICVELEESERTRGDEKSLIAELRALALEHESTRRIEAYLIHPSFPVDIRHNAKIFREKLAVWAAAKLGRG